MRPYNVEIFTQDFEMVGNTNVNEITYKEDYLSSDGNTVTVLALPGVKKQDYIRISRGNEEYAGIVTEIGYGTDKSKKLQTISYKPLMELLNTDVLFDVDLQGQGSMEQFICDRIKEMFITNEDEMQNIKGLLVSAATATKDWSLHITPSDKGGHYNIVNLIDSVIIPAMEKYSILVKTKLDIQNREVQISVGRAASGVITIESDLPNIIKKSVTIKQVSADVNKLVIYDSSDYETKRVYYLHPDLGYDTKDRDRITPVVCEMQAVSHEEGSSFESAAISAAHNKFANLSYSNLIELTMMNGDALVKPEELEFGQVADIISDGQSYRSILTGRERGKNTKLVFGTVRLDLTKKGGNVTPQDDAIIYETAIPGSGIFKGCEVTYARGNVLHISQGFGMIRGRFFEVYETEIDVRLADVGETLQGRVYIHLDLSNADEPIKILAQAAAELPPLDADVNINYNNSSYDLELAIFTVSSAGLDGLTKVFPTLKAGSGGGGGGGETLTRATSYAVGDAVTAVGAPGWATLVCTQAGTTAASEPSGYSRITKVGDRVLDGTAVFTARNIIRELDGLIVCIMGLKPSP